MDDDRGMWNESPASEVDADMSPDTATVNAIDDEVSRPFVGRWNHLVSETNWEKGRIICQWRECLQAAAVSPSEYSDEAWTRRVGGVTGQHVGRLRRVFQRFGNAYTNYQGLYWSHFFAALDWDDAEMWLEGAVQNGWSVSQTRRMRWQTLGELPDERPRVEDEVHSELDEDFEPALRAEPGIANSEAAGPAVVESAGDAADDGEIVQEEPSPWEADEAFPAEPPARVRPFADIPDLPNDLAEAFDAFKLAILAHRAQGWQDISATDVVLTLDALKALVLAPVDE